VSEAVEVPNGLEIGSSTNRTAPRILLKALFDEAVSAVSAERSVPRHLADISGAGRTVILAVGKGAAAMASVAALHLDGPIEGLVVTRHGHAGPLFPLPSSIEVIEAGHPVPDDDSIAAADRALAIANGLTAKDHLLALMSGGGSALLAKPLPGVSLADKQSITQSLLRSGATIAEINSVRKHLSAIKGGRLAVAAAPARVTTLIISDIPGDIASLVASGPTVADDTTLALAREIVARYRIEVPPSISAALIDPASETPPADTLGLAGSEVRIIATAKDALQAARRLAEEQGYQITDLGDNLQAEARHLGAGHAALARRLSGDGQPRIILSGGETTVRVVNAEGRGGRNLEYLLGLAIALDGAPRIHAIACDTDGIDGTEDNAGGIVTPDTLARAAALGLDARTMLEANMSYAFFAALGDLVVTGPTRTNVNDIRAILIEGGEA
jgi:hydroxypyruvate reductase